MGRNGSISQLSRLLEQIDGIMTDMVIETSVKKQENLLDRYHTIYQDLMNWGERNPDFKEYRGYIEMKDDYKYIMNSIVKPIDVDNYEDNMYW